MAVLDDLHERLGRTRRPDRLAGSGRDYGTCTPWLRDLAGYWRDGFDWAAQQRALNAWRLVSA